MTEPTSDEEIRDFTLSMKPHKFKIDDDVFAAPAVISPVVLLHMAGLHATLGGINAQTPDGLGKVLGTVGDIFKMMLPGTSGQRFAARLEADGSDPETPPIDLTRQAIPALYWLLERYGLRPTVQSSPLPSDSGTGALTDGAPETAPTGEASLEPTNS